MSINYDLYQNPPRNGNADKGLHPRAVNHGTISTKELAERINKSSSFTQGDVLGLLSLLSDEIVNAFNESKSISIDGLGIFAVSLQSRPVSEAKEIHSQSIEVKNITFRASNQLKSRVCKLSAASNRAKPKSAMKGLPFLSISMFSGLISRCTTPLRWA